MGEGTRGQLAGSLALLVGCLRKSRVLLMSAAEKLHTSNREGSNDIHHDDGRRDQGKRDCGVEPFRVHSDCNRACC